MSATQTFRSSVSAAESRWYDVARWPLWVDGLDRIVETSDGWPRAGASVTWQSGPAGRGRVSERVIAYEPLGGQTLEVEDDAITGRQEVAFTPAADDGEDEVEVRLSLEYEIKKRSFFTPLIDLLFIRRVMAASLQATLARFGAELSGRG